MVSASQDVLHAWARCAQTTGEFLEGVPEERLHALPFVPRFETFSWEFACLIRTRLCYLEALRTRRRLSFVDRAGIPPKDRLEKRGKSELSTLLLNTASSISIAIVDSKARRLPLFLNLLEHERLHHGKLILYFAQCFMNFPPTLISDWGEDNFVTYET